jgi:tetratricopeptide (TPR) repeat protein
MPQICCRLLFVLVVAVPLETNLPLTISPALAQTNQVTQQDTEADRIAQLAEAKEQILEANRLSQLGIQQFNNGQTQPALETFQQELELRRQLGDRQGELITLGWLGGINQRLGKYQQALQFFQDALEIAQDIGDRSGEGTSLNNIGLIYSRLG